MAPTVILVGADKGGVGKTMVSRALCDYLVARNVRHKVFDTECPAGDLVRFHKEATICDITKVEDQMKIFDVMQPDDLMVADLRAGLLSPTIKALDEAKLLEDVRQGNMHLVLLHVLGPTISSINEVSASAAAIGGGAKHVLVKNYINDGSSYFEWEKGDVQATFDRLKDITIVVPNLAEMLCETMQKSGGTFWDYAKDKTQSRIGRGRVLTWLQKVWGEFDRVKLLAG